MFVQVISGRTSQPEALRERFELWDEAVRSGAAGFLGSTGGVTDDGEVIVLARFEDERAARANSDRPEQGEWWQDTAALFDGDPEFADTTDTATWHEGGSDDAEFVQVMRGRTTDRAAAKELFTRFEGQLRAARPDILGSVVAWHDGDRFTQAVYFQDEATARENEGAELPPEAAELMSRFDELMSDIEYLDLRDPWLR